MRKRSSNASEASAAPDPRAVPGPPAASPPTAAPLAHLSGQVRMDHWLPLLVVLATGLLMAAAIAVVVRLLGLVHHTVMLFALGGIVAYALDPIVEWVRGTYGPPARRRPRWAGVLTVFALLLLAAMAGTYALGREAAAQAQFLAANRDQIQASAVEKVHEWDQALADRGIPIHLAELINHPPENVRNWGETVARGSFGVVSGASRSLVEGVVVLLIAIYLLLYSEEISGRTLAALPERARPYAIEWKDGVNRILGGFVRGQALLALVLGAAAAIACLAIGLRLWLLIGFFVVIASLLPVVGPYIGAMPALAAAVLTPPNGFLTPLTRSILVVVLFFLINEAGSKILYPRLVGKALGLHEVLVLLALLAGFEIGGIAGVFFAAPFTALAGVTIVQLWRLWNGLPARPAALVAMEDTATPPPSPPEPA